MADLERSGKDKKQELSGRSALLEIYNIWYTFGLGDRTPKSAVVRDDRITSLERRLSAEAAGHINEFVLHTVEGVEKPIERGEQTRLLALNDAKDVLVQRELDKLRERRSKGMKLHIRRDKAKTRRGTNPRDIH